MSLFSLPLELLLCITESLEYASDLNALAQACHLSHTIFNPQLYSIFANSCEPNVLRLVETGNLSALRKLVSAGYRLFDFLETPESWWKECFLYGYNKLESRSPMMIAAGNGHIKILQLFIDNLPSIIIRSAPRSSHLLGHAAKRGQLDVVKFLIAQGAQVDHFDNMGRNNSVLKSAIMGGHLPVVKYLGEQSNCKDLTQNSALGLLHSATTAGHVEVVKYLVNCGADFTCPPSAHVSEHGPPSALETAINMGHEEIALFFLDNVPPELVDAVSVIGWKSILKPCLRDAHPRPWPSPWGNPHIAQMILARIDLEIELAATTPLGQSNLLAVAAETGDLSLTKRLLDMGCKPISSRMRYTPVSRAVYNGHAEITETFLHCPGYPVSEKDVYAAAKKGEKAIVLRLLRKAGDKDFKSLAKVALNSACSSDKFILLMQTVLDLLGKQDVETVVSMATSSTGPEASCGGHLEATKFLLEKGGNQPSNKIPKYFDVLKQRSKASTSFLEHAAAVCPVPQFQVALAQWNLELNPENDACKAALVAAVLHKKAKTIQLFADKGFDLTSTYLHRGKLSPLLHLVVKTLKDENGQVIDVDDEHAQLRQSYQPDGHLWLDHIHPRASIQLLIEHGADINQVDSYGRTALFLATQIRTLVLTKELLRLGANPLLKGPGTVSPLELAISQGQTKYVKAFLEAVEARSFTCDDFVGLIPDVLPVRTLPNRASREQFPVSSRLSQSRLLARGGRMGPTKTFPHTCRDVHRRDSMSSEHTSTDDDITDDEITDEEITDEEITDEEITDEEITDDEITDEGATDEENLREGLTSKDNFISIWSATEDDDCIGDLRWVRFFIAKAMTQHHCRMMYPVPV
ncbi:hypothetical protein PENSOL_c075G03209 [Penicillium solitum]|uniref:F-box domain-containing protein n=1 Tax=Penicillium solitum TaxID=60172 RepID=A0A1V6QGC6_9EURO|nr:uncharacterized protein PENSOL_c075G03209 [Penicillium solitum]OQD87946.1 hypothetical protein PENSOL_c075G03209 [Penicillium solitum]